MGKIADELRKKYGDPRKALKALGLDESLISTENLMSKLPTRFANTALKLTAAMVRPVLAKDAKIDLYPIFKDVTAKDFSAKKTMLALDSALKGKLAKDATMEHVAEMLDNLEGSKPETADESVSEEQHGAMAAAAKGEGKLGIPEHVGKEFLRADKGKSFDEDGFKKFLHEKGVGDEDIDAAIDMIGHRAASDEDEEEARKKKEEEERAAKAKDAEVEELKEKVESQDEEIKKVKQASDAAIKTARDNERGIRLALDEVRPIVGEIPLKAQMAFDSAADVYRHVLVMRKVDGADKLHESALKPMISLLPKAAGRQEQAPSIAMDADTAKRTSDRFPELDRIEQV